MTRDEWLVERTKGIGASEAAAVLGIDHWAGAMEVYARKIGAWGETETNNAMRWGLYLEAPIAEEYARVTGRKVRRNTDYTIMKLPGKPHIRCTPDAWIEDPKRGPGILQIKSTRRESDWTRGVPDPVQVQVNQEMLCCGVAWGSVAVLIGTRWEFRHFDLDRHEAFCTKVLIPALDEFWCRIQERRPPPADATKTCGKALTALYPYDTGESVALGNEFLAADVQRLGIIRQMDALKKEKERLENLLKAEIKTATFGVLPNGVRYSLRLTKVKGYTKTIEPFEYRRLWRHET